jgi:hypothetical protein
VETEFNGRNPVAVGKTRRYSHDISCIVSRGTGTASMSFWGGGWSGTESSITEATTGLLYQPWMMMDDKDLRSNRRNYWQEKPKYSEKTCPSANLSITNPTWPDPGSNLDRRGGSRWLTARATARPSFLVSHTMVSLTPDHLSGYRNVSILLLESRFFAALPYWPCNRVDSYAGMWVSVWMLLEFQIVTARTEGNVC